ncbi:Phosphoglycolate phosphatase OS=Castellaniella defragrans OX=75697 GN=HNR28_003021 PE=4 SV=1 [Castellaniella denitrificans]|jgi:phosphoglycolate phosphatase|uniref:HAD-IA family hydrolase n=1 Tax=Castellaniella denitrificans TaxID=56119 RepID=UPI00362399A3
MNAPDPTAIHPAPVPGLDAPVKRYRAVIFDWDGTLLDSTYHIVEALLGACRDLELRVPSREEAGWVIGLSLQAALYRLVPELGADRADAFVDRYRAHFMALQHEMHLFEGQAGLLRDLHAGGAVLGVATGKSRRGLDASIERLDLRGLFRATRTADEARGKPDPDMLLQLLAELDLDPESVLMVGDTTHDVLMARAAGVDSLAVAYGAHAPSLLESARPTALAATVPDMQAWIRARAG